MSARTPRIGVFGGAFDPPHNGHVALAQSAIADLSLDQLLVVPTGQAWHKARTLSPPEHRLAMARLAFDGVPKVQVDAREMQRVGPSFTVDTLQSLHLENPEAELFLIMGADQLAVFRQWHQWQVILELAIICIADRAINTVTTGLFDGYLEQKHRFLMLQMPLTPISATQIRQLLADSPAHTAQISHLVSPAVARYIASHQLYSAGQAVR